MTKPLNPLEKSINKWKRIITGKGLDRDIENCALCKEYYNNNCNDCPVFLKTDMYGCGNTPYDKWSLHQARMHKDKAVSRVYCDVCKRLAQKELKFLQSLKVEE